MQYGTIITARRLYRRIRRLTLVAGGLALYLLAGPLASCTRHAGGPPTATSPRPMRTAYTVHRNVVYTPAAWPQPLAADVYVPEGTGPFPGVLVVHGGGWARGKRTDMNYIAKRLAKRGYTVMNSEYRLAPAFQFPAQLQDLQQAVRWMRQNATRYRIDPQRIGAFGYSAGGHLAALLGTVGPGDSFDEESGEHDLRLQAVVAGGAPTDLRKFRGGTLVPQFLGATIDENPHVFARASPVVYVSSDDPPMFLYHASLDTLVDISHAQDMKQALDDVSIPAELYIVRGLGHMTLFVLNRSAVEEGINFLDRYLRSE